MIRKLIQKNSFHHPKNYIYSFIISHKKFTSFITKFNLKNKITNFIRTPNIFYFPIFSQEPNKGSKKPPQQQNLQERKKGEGGVPTRSPHQIWPSSGSPPRLYAVTPSVSVTLGRIQRKQQWRMRGNNHHLWPNPSRNPRVWVEETVGDEPHMWVWGV